MSADNDDTEKETRNNLNPLLYLPPLDADAHAWTAIKDDLITLKLYNAELLNKRNQRMCITTDTTTTSLSSSEVTASSLLVRALQSAMHEYQRQLYTERANNNTVTSRFHVEQHKGDDGECDNNNNNNNVITIHSCAELSASAHSCRVGCWTAQWNIAVLRGGKSTQVSGNVDLHLYHYEDGSNVQFRAKRRFPPQKITIMSGSSTLRDDDDDDHSPQPQPQLAQSIVDIIATCESSLFVELSSYFDNNHSHGNHTTNTNHNHNRNNNNNGDMEANLRQIRRILPVTKTRFKWDTAAQASVQLLNARSK